MKIPTYEARGQVSTQPAEAYIPRMPGTGAEQIGEALIGVGNQLGRAAAIVHQTDQQKAYEERVAAEKAARIKEDQDKRWARESAIEFQTTITERVFQAQQEMPDGGVYAEGKDFTDVVQGINDETTEAFIGMAPNPEAAEFLRGDILPFSARTHLESLNTQAQEAGRYALQQHMDMSQKEMNLLLKRPDMLEEVWNSHMELLESSPSISNQNKRAIRSKIGPSFASVPIQVDLNAAKMGEITGQEILEKLEKGVYEKQAERLGLTLGPDVWQDAFDKASALTRVKDQEQLQLLRQQADDVITSASITGKQPADSEIARFAPLGEAFTNDLREKAEIGAVTRNAREWIQYDPTGFSRTELRKYEPKAGEGATKQAKIYDVLVTELGKQAKQIQENPGDAAEAWYKKISSSPDIGLERSMAYLLQDLSTQPDKKLALTSDPATGHLDEYSKSQLKMAYLRQQGVPAHRIEVLSSDNAKTLVAQLTKPDPMSPQGQYESIRQNMQSVKQMYKDHYPKVLNQLIKEGLPQEYAILEWADGTIITNKLVASMQQKTSILEKNLSDAKGGTMAQSDFTGIKAAVSETTATYSRALTLGAPDGKRSSFIRNMNDVIYKLTLQDMVANPEKSANEVVEEIGKKLITDRFHLVDTLAIPRYLKGQKTDPDLVTGRLEEYKKYLTPGHIRADYGVNIPLPKDIKKNELLEYVKTNGYWVTNENSSGAYLVIDVGGYTAVPVVGNNTENRRIELDYSALSSSNYRDPRALDRIKKTLKKNDMQKWFP